MLGAIYRGEAPPPDPSARILSALADINRQTSSSTVAGRSYLSAISTSLAHDESLSDLPVSTMSTLTGLSPYMLQHAKSTEPGAIVSRKPDPRKIDANNPVYTEVMALLMAKSQPANGVRSFILNRKTKERVQRRYLFESYKDLHAQLPKSIKLDYSTFCKLIPFNYSPAPPRTCLCTM